MPKFLSKHLTTGKPPPQPPRLTFAPSRPMCTQPAFAPLARPIFIIGAPRSGTSISTWALGQHPNIQPMPETAWIAVSTVAAVQAYEVGSERGRFSHLSNVEMPPEPFFRRIGEAIDNIVKDAFDERCTRLHGNWRAQEEIRNPETHPMPEMLLRRRADDPKARWIDGTPLNSMYAWALSMVFPGAHFLHLLRRPHEVVTSLCNFDAVGGIKHEIDEAIQNWIDHTRVAFLTQRALGRTRVYTARFEDLSEAPRRFYGEILDFLGEGWCDDVLKPLSNKINSSNVDETRERVRKEISERPLYREAEALYQQIITWKPTETGEAEVLDQLRAGVIEQARSRRLIG